MVKKRNRSSDSSSELSVARLLLSSVLGLLITLGFTLLASFAISKEMLPLESSHWVGPLIIGIASFLCSWSATWRKNKKLITGLLASLFFGLFLYVCGMLFFDAPMDTAQLLVSAGALLVGSFAGIFAFPMLE